MRSDRLLAMPGRLLTDLDADTAARLVTAAADIVLVLDHEGVIRDLALASNDLLEWGCQRWLDKPWAQTVTIESQPKVRALLEPQLGSGSNVRWRQVNHMTEAGADLPVSYSVVPLGGSAAYSLALGRDLRPQAALQQRLVAAQQSMERDYWRLRQLETRYRLLFQTAVEPVLILKDALEHIEEANPAAQQLFGEQARRPGWSLATSLAPASVTQLRQMLERLRSAGRAEPVAVTLAGTQQVLSVSASQFRQDNALHYLLRFSSEQPLVPVDAGDGARLWPLLLERAPDAWVVTDTAGHVLSCNHAFLDLAQLGSAEQAQGRMLERWLGRSEVDFRVLASTLRQHETVRLFATRIQGEHGGGAEVEVSAVATESAGQRCYAFTIRDMGRRLGPDGRGAKELPRSAGQMAELVGRMPLKDIVRETTDLIEQLCIESALQLTGDNRASAAELLGLSRQSLYIKLRRYGMVDAGPEPDPGPDPDNAADAAQAR